MSGEGVIAGCPFVAMPEPGPGERGDMLAYLERRRDNAALLAARWPEFEHEARVQRRQFDIIIGDVRAGMHEGAAGVRARLLKQRETTDGA